MSEAESEWKEVLRPYFRSPAWKIATKYVRIADETSTILPPPGTRLRAFKETAPYDVKVVMLGQDPYARPGLATGLAFEIPQGLPVEEEPPSYRNIQKELLADAGSRKPIGIHHAKQGVLLLNAFLTVEVGRPMSHSFLWKGMIESVSAALAKRVDDVVWVALGQAAQVSLRKVAKLNDSHVVLRLPHPSPQAGVSGGVPFVGSKPFSLVNGVLRKKGLETIDW